MATYLKALLYFEIWTPQPFRYTYLTSNHIASKSPTSEGSPRIFQILM